MDSSRGPTFGVFSYEKSRGSKIDNNVFYGEARKASVKLLHDTSAYLRNNVIDGRENSLNVGVNAVLLESDFNRFLHDGLGAIVYGGTAYESFLAYRADHLHQDKHSSVGKADFRNASGGEFRLRSSSELIDAGTFVGNAEGFLGSLLTSETVPDIGAYEMNEGVVNASVGEIYDAFCY